MTAVKEANIIAVDRSLLPGSVQLVLMSVKKKVLTVATRTKPVRNSIPDVEYHWTPSAFWQIHTHLAIQRNLIQV